MAQPKIDFTAGGSISTPQADKAFGPLKGGYKPAPLPKKFDIGAQPKEQQPELTQRWTMQHAPDVAKLTDMSSMLGKKVTTPPPPTEAVAGAPAKPTTPAKPKGKHFARWTGTEMQMVEAPGGKEMPKPEVGMRSVMQDGQRVMVGRRPEMTPEQLAKHQSTPEMNTEQMAAVATRWGFDSIADMQAYVRAGQQMMIDRRKRREIALRNRLQLAGDQAI